MLEVSDYQFIQQVCGKKFLLLSDNPLIPGSFSSIIMRIALLILKYNFCNNEI